MSVAAIAHVSDLLPELASDLPGCSGADKLAELERAAREFCDRSRVWRTRIEIGEQSLEVRAYLERFLFSSHEQRKQVGTLSGGERARVALARTLRDGAFRSPEDTTTYFSRLADVLLPPELPARLAGHDRLVVEPSPSLARVPWSALRVGPDRRMLGELVDGRLALELLVELAAHAGEPVHVLDHVDRDADRARLVGDRAGDRLADPPRGVGGELEALGVVELVDRPHQPEVALLDQVEQLHAAAGVTLGDRHDQAQVGLGELALGALAALHGPQQHPLASHVADG